MKNYKTFEENIQLENKYKVCRVALGYLHLFQALAKVPWPRAISWKEEVADREGIAGQGGMSVAGTG